MRRALVTLLASCVAVLGGLAPAGVAHAATTTDASPATSVVSCLSSNVWLRLWGTLGETCYVGNGIILVNLPGIQREQILGFHTVCLRTVSSVRCAMGPRTLTYVPPLAVREITITTP